MSTAKKNKVTFRTIFISIVGGRFLGTDWFLKHLPFLVFVFVLLVGVVAYKYSYEKTLLSIEQTKKMIQKYKAASVLYEAEVMEVNRPSAITERVKALNMDIREPIEPPRKLKVKKLEEE